MKTPRVLSAVALLALFLSASAALQAQVPTGTPPFGSFGGGPDVINLSNLNSHLTIPILNKTGRGLPFRYNLTYDSSVWNPVTSGGTTSWVPVNYWGWGVQTAVATGYVHVNSILAYCYTGHVPSGTDTKYGSWTFVDQFGVAHSVAGTTEVKTGTCGSSTTSLNVAATDGSGYTISVTGGALNSVTSRYGKIINPPVQAASGAATVTDANGNQITVDSSGHFTDTMGSTSPYVLTVSQNAPSPSSPTTFTYNAPGGSQQITMKYTNYTVATNFGCSAVEYSPTTAALVSEIDLPDGTAYYFQYEKTPGDTHTPNYVTARVASITLPTTGEIVYTYAGGSEGVECSDGSTAGLTRQTPDGTWTYARTLGTSPATQTTITDPQSNQMVVNFQGIYETERQVYQGSTSGTLLNTTFTCYNASTPNCNSTAITLPILERDRYVQWPGGLESRNSTTYDSYGDVTEVDEYAYGSGSPGSVVRKTITTLASLGAIIGKPSVIKVEDGSGNIKSQTNYSYDQGSVTTTSSPQHVSVSGSRGNLTTVSRLVSGTTYLTSTSTYFDTGVLQTSTDANGAVTAYVFTGGTTCGNTFPVSISEPLSLSRSMAWNCTGGVQATLSDENSQPSSVTWTDPDFWRPTQSTDSASNQTNFTYGGATYSESSMLFNGGASTNDIRKTFDSLGRVLVSQVKQSPSSSTYDSVETDYDSLGRPSRTTVPYSAAAGVTNSSAPATTTTYDALSRKLTINVSGGKSTTLTYAQNDVYRTVGPAPSGENAKRKQMEYDALGRLTSVCEITSGTGSGTCAQTNSVTGFWTKYTYDVNNRLTGVTQNAQSSGSQQTRSYVYDGLGRITSETNPESQTTSYTYDTDATCGTSSGDLVKKVDAVGNTICYSYDALHRVIMTTYTGTYSSVTPTRHFVYDSATVNSVSMANAKTRLAEAYTCVSPCTTKITDLGFSYNDVGDVSDYYESTPHSGGYYHLNSTYHGNHTPNALSGLSGLPTMTYTLDGEGRVYSVAAGSGQNPLTSVTYNAASLATQINLGSGDSDAYTYDPNTERMTQYKFTVGGQSATGALTWNAIGTLETLAITDALYSSGSQTCSYSHDDLSRIASANCGTPWSQTFSYDAFGNITKSGTVSFSPTYSYATNQMTQIGGSSPSYDANGNVTNDFLHTYAWDANGRPTTIDTITMTYDALGRAVERLKSGAYTQTVYAPYGSKLAMMSGSSFQKAFVGLARGSSVVYNSSGIQYYRHSDWLGSYRVGSTSTQTLYYDGAYAPFGEPYAQSGSTDLSFTGMNQDITSNLYDFPAREYGTQGRWPSPDPAGSSSATPNDPQTWNRYAYVTNSPMGYLDATGMVRTPPGLVPGGDGGGWSIDFGACAWDDGSNDDPDDPNTGTYDSCTAAGGTFISQLGDSDYNPNPNQDLSDYVAEIQDSQIVNVDAANDGAPNCISPGVCISPIDNFNLMEIGKTNYRDPFSICSTHTTVDNSTGATSSHVDLFNPGTSIPTGPITGNVPALPFHLLFDALPDAIYRVTGQYLLPAGRGLCQ